MKRAVLMLFMVLFPLGALAADLKIYTEEYPPYNTAAGGTLGGVNTELLLKALDKAGVGIGRDDIELVPWSRAYQGALSEAGTCVFSTTRTDERENLFKWVGPLSKTQTAFVAKKGSGITLSSPADAGQYVVGVVKDDVGHQLALAAGLPEDKLDIASSADAQVKKLDAGRVDLIVYEVLSVQKLAESLGLDPNSFESALVLKEGELYLACNPGTNDDLLKTIQTALDEVK